jgi:hypothetical protein
VIMLHNQIMLFYLAVYNDHSWMSFSGCVSWSQLNVIILLCIMITAECHYLVVYPDHSWMSLSDCASWSQLSLSDCVLWSQLNVIIWLCIMITAVLSVCILWSQLIVIMIHNKIMTFSCDHNTQSDNDSCDHDTQPDNDIQLWS